MHGVMVQESTPSGSKSIRDVLRGLRATSSEVIGSAVVNTGGFTVAAMLPTDVDVEAVAGMAAALLGVGERMADELMGADAVQTYVRSRNGYLIVNQVGTNAMLIVLTTSEAKLGLVFLDIQRRLAALEHLVA